MRSKSRRLPWSLRFSQLSKPGSEGRQLPYRGSRTSSNVAEDPYHSKKLIWLESHRAPPLPAERARGNIRNRTFIYISGCKASSLLWFHTDAFPEPWYACKDEGRDLWHELSCVLACVSSCRSRQHAPVHHSFAGGTHSPFNPSSPCPARDLTHSYAAA